MILRRSGATSPPALLMAPLQDLKRSFGRIPKSSHIIERKSHKAGTNYQASGRSPAG